MRTNPLPEDADALMSLAHAVATLLEEKHDELRINPDVEALLRASIAAATFAINTYLAILAGAKKSPVALGYVAEAQRRCDRKIELLRRQVTRSIAQLCRLMNDEDLIELAEHVASMSS